ncbi:MAG: hypothetical protein ACRC33_09530, partial [Gemmataceae bacterium]
MDDLDDVLLDLLPRLNRGDSFAALFDAVYDGLYGRVPFARLALGLLDDAGTHLRLAACRSDGPE